MRTTILVLGGPWACLDQTAFSYVTMDQIDHLFKMSSSFLVRDSDPSSKPLFIFLSAIFKKSGIPSIAIACKCDLEKRVSPGEVARAADPFGCKLIEVSRHLDDGKKRMRRAFDILVQQIIAIPGKPRKLTTCLPVRPCGLPNY